MLSGLLSWRGPYQLRPGCCAGGVMAAGAQRSLHLHHAPAQATEHITGEISRTWSVSLAAINNGQHQSGDASSLHMTDIQAPTESDIALSQTHLLPAVLLTPRYEDYGAAAAAAPYGYAAAAPAAPAYPAPAPAASAYAAPAAGYAAAAPDPNAAALAAAAAGGQQMYILQDGVLKPLTVMYQQPAAAPAAPPAGAAAGQALQGLAGYGAPPAQPAYGAPAAAVAPAAPSSTGAPGGAVLYQQPGGAYTYAAAPAADAAAAQATVAAGGWVGAVQQLATSQPGGAPAYAAAGNAAPAYAQPAVSCMPVHGINRSRAVVKVSNAGLTFAPDMQPQ